MTYSESKKAVQFIRALAWITSFVFHPILAPTWLFLILSVYAPITLNPIADDGKKNLIFVVFISTFLLPLLILTSLFLISSKGISWNKFIMGKRRDRVLPFAFIATYYFTLTWYLFDQLGQIIFIIMLTLTVLIILLFLISTFWKISAHAIGMGGVLGIIIALSYIFPTAQLLVPAVMVVLASGLTLSARLYLQEHKPSQIFAGFILGLSVSLISIYYNLIV